jgi:hypothetical protein
MAQWNPIVITLQGQALVAKVGTTAGLELAFTRVELSNTQYPSTTDLEALTALDGVQQSAPVNNVAYIAPNSIRVRAPFTNAEVETGYYIYTNGMHATDPDLGEILFAVVTASTADWMPPTGSSSAASMIVEHIYPYNNASDTVSMTVDPTGMATIRDIQEVNAVITAHTSDMNNPHGVTYSQTGAAPPSLVGTESPTSSTQGVVGQFFFNTQSEELYICTSAGSTYSWRPVGGSGSDGYASRHIFSELDDLQICAATLTNAASGWNSVTFPRAFNGIPALSIGIVGDTAGIGYVQTNNITATGFQYQVKYTTALTAPNFANVATALTLAYTAIYDGGVQ